MWVGLLLESLADAVAVLARRQKPIIRASLGAARMAAGSLLAEGWLEPAALLDDLSEATEKALAEQAAPQDSFVVRVIAA